ncbi:MAG TPA: CGNR zinc finger domain-containing protein [Candidatus Limnocylindria bacterium]
MRDIPRADHDFEFVGGSVALDFANTLGGMHTAPTHEHLVEYADLVEFGRSAGTLARPETRRLAEEAARQPARAAGVLRRAIALREAIWRVFDAFAKSERADPADFATIQGEELAALKHARFAQSGSDVADRWSDELLLDRPLWDIARSAVELLRSKSDLSRVRECGSDTCEWLFIDKSRNHSRRWCDMNDCGNVAKVRRFRARQRAPTTKASR